MTTRIVRVVRLLTVLCVVAAVFGCGKKSGDSSSSSSSSMGTAGQESTGTSSAMSGSSTMSGSSSGGAMGTAAGAGAASSSHAATNTNHHPALASSQWHVDEIEGQAVETVSQASLAFDSGGKVSGSTGCNSFTGSAKMTGTSVHFAPVASTKKSCPPDAMSQETRMLKALGNVTGYDVDSTGVLHLTGADGGTLLKLTRATA